jgi:hypothetical protein
MGRQSDGQIAEAEGANGSGEAPADDDTAGITTIDPARSNFAGR